MENSTGMALKPSRKALVWLLAGFFMAGCAVTPPKPQNASKAVTEAPRAALAVAAAALPPPKTYSLLLAWDASNGPGVAGYKLYYGSAARTYTNSVDVGNVLIAGISNLLVGATYHIAATCYDSSGLESDYSAEVTWTQTNQAPALLIMATPMQGSSVNGPWAPVPGWPAMTLTNPPGNTFFRFAITNWAQ